VRLPKFWGQQTYTVVSLAPGKKLRVTIPIIMHSFELSTVVGHATQAFHGVRVSKQEHSEHMNQVTWGSCSNGMTCTVGEGFCNPCKIEYEANSTLHPGLQIRQVHAGCLDHGCLAAMGPILPDLSTLVRKFENTNNILVLDLKSHIAVEITNFDCSKLIRIIKTL